MRECCDCRENDRCFSMSLNYKCENDCCINFIPSYSNIITPKKRIIRRKRNLVQTNIRTFFIKII